MLHELLYALLGYTGDIIIFQDGKFMVNPALYSTDGTNPKALLNISEVELMNRLVELGWQYKQIAQFNDRYSGIGSQDGGLASHLAYGK